MTATIIDFMKKRTEKGTVSNHDTIIKLVHEADHAARAAKQWPQGRENWLRHCRDNLEKALIHLNEELDGPQDES